MINRILYRLSSPLAREIIDSLRTEPGEWEPRKSGQGVVTVLHHKRIGSFATPASWSWGRRPPTMWGESFKMCDRLALRRAIKKWEKAKRDAL